MQSNKSTYRSKALRCFFALILIGLSTTCSAQSSSAPSAIDLRQVQTYHLPNKEFEIPFDISANGRQPKEVQLEYSTDGGVQWQYFSKLPVLRDRRAKRAFAFRAPEDGLYLFRLTTLDEAGNPFPSNDAPMAIAVDSKQPMAEMEISLDAEGHLVATFAVVDNYLVPESIRLEYLVEGDQAWKPVDVQLTESQPTQARGQVVWDVAPNVRRIVVRLLGKDQAGNSFEIVRNPEVPRTAELSGSLQLASQRNNAPVQRIAQQSTPQPSFSSGSIANPFVPPVANNARPANIPSNANTLPPPPGLGQQSSIQLGPTSPGAAGQNAYLPAPKGNSNDAALQLFPSGGEIQRNTGAMPPRIQPSKQLADGSYELQQLPNVPAGLPVSAANPNRDASRQPLANPAMVIDDTSAVQRTVEESGVEPFYSDSRTFSLDYALDDDTVSSVRAVELWGTVDSGKTWDHWDNDPDRKSPFDIQVEEDGLFGFRMVIVDANGQSGSQPRSGEDPDVWVNVDTQMPTARLLSALYGKGQETGSLVIEFACKDNLFGERPINLYFAESPQGPWSTIAAGLPNTGRYVWKADPNMPRKIYLKVEAVDQAGNVGGHIGDIPVDVQGLAPRGRFQGIRPINPGK